MKKPCIAIEVEGGLVQSVYANIPGIEVFKIDLDTEGADEDDNTDMEGCFNVDEAWFSMVEPELVEEEQIDHLRQIWERENG